MRVWLDDERPMPAGFDRHCRTAAEAIHCLKSGGVTFVAFDHDLGDDAAGTGYDVAKHVEEAAYFGTAPPPDWSVQSANAVGRNNIDAAMANAHRYWASRRIDHAEVFNQGNPKFKTRNNA